jgi:acetyl-CoA carboxylase, biotin carboxylase subunit
VRTPDEIGTAFEAAMGEATRAFGAGEVYLERYVEHARHVEIQILADTHGRVVALGERDCSIQRRYQKLIEESPSPALTPALRRRMSEAATTAAAAVRYVGAGTVEFLLTGSDFHFLEMNTRLQVEHPVTEMLYGIDIVREQLRIAAGHPLRVPPRSLEPRGHAIECRISAEDPRAGFLPATGIVRYLRVPGGPGVRWDGGIEPGSEVTSLYDSLLGKLIAWGETREVARRRMRRALDELVIVGLRTTQGFHRRVMDDPRFVRGDYDTTYVETEAPLLIADLGTEEREVVAVAAAMLEEDHRRVTLAAPHAPMLSPWVIAARREALRE